MSRPTNLLLSLLAILALAVAGCGSSGKRGTKATAKGTATPSKKDPDGQGKGKDETEQDPRLCGKLGITPESEKEGTCNQGQGDQKHSVTFANGSSKLRLEELDLRVRRVTTPSSISGLAGTIEPKDGKDENGKTIEKAFVVVEMSWKNKDDKSRRLNESGKQLKLGTANGGGVVYPLAERSAPESFYNAPEVKPGGKQTGVAIYQLPVAAVDAIELRGARPQLIVWEFRTAGKPKKPAAGYIRLWNLK